MLCARGCGVIAAQRQLRRDVIVVRRVALNSSTMIGISSRTIQAPSSVLVIATMTSTTPVTTAPKPLMSALVFQPGSRSLPPVNDHAGLRQRERDEHADHVERQQRAACRRGTR